MTADATDTKPWPLWLLRFTGSGDPEAFSDLICSVSCSPPCGGVSRREAAAVLALLEDYAERGHPSVASYAAVEAFLVPGSLAAIALEAFRCLDRVHREPESYELGVVERGIRLARSAGDREVEARFLSFKAGWHARTGAAPLTTPLHDLN